jgi:putative oxidoreductase
MSKQRDGLFGEPEDVDGLDDLDVPEAPEGTGVPDAVEEREADEAGGDADAKPPRSRVSRDIYDVVGRARPQKIVPAEPEPEPDPEPEPESAAQPVAGPGDDVNGSARTEVFAAENGGRADEDYRLPEPLNDDAATTAFAGTPAAYTDPEPDYGAPAGDDAGPTRVFAPATAAAFAGASGTVADEGYEGYEETYGASGAPGAGQEPGAVPGTESGTVPGAVPEEGAAVDGASAAPARRGTLDLGLLILRIVAGVMLGLRGVQTLFAFGGDPGVDSLEQIFGVYDGASVLALALPIAELVGGALLLLGLLTPLGGAVAVVSAGFMALHYLSSSAADYWPYQLDANAQAWGFLAVLGLVLIFTGPGRYAVDGSRGWATRPRFSAWLFAVIALAGGAALWILVGGGNPF